MPWWSSEREGECVCVCFHWPAGRPLSVVCIEVHTYVQYSDDDVRTRITGRARTGARGRQASAPATSRGGRAQDPDPRGSARIHPSIHPSRQGRSRSRSRSRRLRAGGRLLLLLEHLPLTQVRLYIVHCTLLIIVQCTLYRKCTTYIPLARGSERMRPGHGVPARRASEPSMAGAAPYIFPYNKIQ